MLRQRTLPLPTEEGELAKWPEAARKKLAAGVVDEARLCNIVDLTLPNVCVYVLGALRRWSFPEPTAPIVIDCDEWRLVPRVSVVRTAQWTRFVVRRRPGCSSISTIAITEGGGKPGCHCWWFTV